MRVLVTTQPAYGHLHPLVPLCRALVSAGHDVAIASSRSFAPQLEATGLDVVVAGIDWLESDIAASFPDYVRHRERGDSKWFLQSEIFGWHTARAMAADLAVWAAGQRVDVVIREPWEIGGALAAARLGVPCVLHGIGAVGNVEEVVDLAGPRLCEHAAELGLPADVWAWVSGELYLDPCPPCLQTTATTFHPARRQLLRPVAFDTSDGDADVPAWMDALGDRPVIYVGLGTVMNRWHGLLQRIVGEVRELDVDVVVTTGPGFDPSALGQQPGNVHVEQYVPLSVLLPRCDLVVCHAGWGTTIAALAHGLPIIAVPLGADGPRTAQHCQTAGLGRSINHDTVGTGPIAAAATELLNSDTIRTAALAARHEIETMPDPHQAANAITALTTIH